MSEDERLGKLEHEFKTYQKQKCRVVGGVERRILNNLAMYVGEQWVWFERGTLRNRNPKKDEKGRITEVNLVLNKIQGVQEKIYGRLTASTPEFRAFPDSKDPAKMAKAEVVSKALRAGDQRLDEDYLRWQRWFWMMIGGGCIEHTPYRRNLYVGTVEKYDEETGKPIWLHIASGEEFPHDAFMQMTSPGPPDPATGQPSPPRVLPEHFKIATETDLQGDYAADVRGFLNTFCPSSIKTVEDLQPGQSLMFADVRLLAWAKKTWPEADYEDIKGQEDFPILTTKISEQVSFANSSLKDLIPVIQGGVQDDDPDMLVVIERYEVVSDEYPPGWSMENDASTGAGFLPAPDESFANGGRYTVFSPGQGVLRDGEIPYADGIPATDFHWNVSATNFYSPDWQTKLNGPQKSINTIASQMRMMANARIFDPILMDGDLTPPETDSPKYWPDAMQDGVAMAQRLNADHLPGVYSKQLEQLIGIFDELAGGADLFSEAKFPGQIRGTGAVSKLQDVMDSLWGPKLRHYYAQMGKVYHRRMNRLKQFSPPSKTMRFTDSTGKVEVFQFHADEILAPGADYYITVEPSTILPESRRERFATMQELLSGPLSGLYLNQRTGQLDWNAIASKLEFGDYRGREAQVAADEKFALSVISAIKEGRTVPPVMPMQNHEVFAVELEAEMNDDDFWLILSPPTREALIGRYEEHMQHLQQAAQAQQQSMIDEQTADIVRQAVQQSMAKVQAEVTEATLTQVRSLAQTDPEALRALLQGDEQMQ